METTIRINTDMLVTDIMELSKKCFRIKRQILFSSHLMVPISFWATWPMPVNSGRELKIMIQKRGNLAEI